MSNAKTIRKASGAAWGARKNNGAKLMQITVDACQHAMGDSGDWTVLANHIARGVSEGAAAEVRNIKLIVNAVLPGITMKADKKQPTGMRISVKDAKLSNSGVDAVASLIERKVSLSGTAIREVLAPKSDKDDAKDFDANAWANREVKKHTRAEIDAMIAALQARRGEAKA
jgi:hypothetical protein